MGRALNTADGRVRHGHGSKGQSPTYVSWYNMLTRCRNPRATKFRYYGGRGVCIDPRWLEFSAFLADMGERPSRKHTLDRYPNGDGNYEPGNCRWATQSEQCRNRRSSRPVVRSDGVSFASMGDAADSVAGNHRGVWACCNGEQKAYLGFGWEYADV